MYRRAAKSTFGCSAGFTLRRVPNLGYFWSIRGTLTHYKDVTRWKGEDRVKRRMAYIGPLVLALAAGLAGARTEAQDSYYRWTDERGNPVLSDRPPPSGTPYEVVSSGSTLKRIVEPTEGAVPAEVKPRVGNDFKQVDTARAAEQVEKNPELCEIAQKNLYTLTESPRVRVRDGESGEYRFLTQEEREAETAKAESAIDAYCE